jgi:hypothetical protein
MSDHEPNPRPDIIYFDVERRVADGVAAAAAEYHPGNNAALKLCTCAEAAKDISEVLESAWACVEDADKFRRRIKALFTPLHSLAERTVDLMNEIQSNPGTTGAGAAMAERRSTFVAEVPFGRSGKLGRLRNKISAHHEKGMSPGEMRTLFGEAEATEIGEWIHSTLSMLLDLIKLPVYSWSVNSTQDGVIHHMFCEPLIASISVAADGHIDQYHGATMCKESPRWQFVDVFAHAAEMSFSLFERPSPKQIIAVSQPPRKAFFDTSVHFLYHAEEPSSPLQHFSPEGTLLNRRGSQ